LFQLIGGFFGALLGRMIGGASVALKVGTGHNLFQAWLGELVFTAILCYVVLATATNSKTEGNSYYGLAIGSVVFVGASSVGAISGGAFNPAVVFGLGSVKNFWKMLRFGYSLWIILANLAGGALGAFIYYVTAPEEFKHFGANFGDLSEEARSLLPTSEGRQ
jgi:aquaporin Z